MHGRLSNADASPLQTDVACLKTLDPLTTLRRTTGHYGISLA